MLSIVDQIIFNFSNNKSLYIGEDLTIAEHMIQTAMLAEKKQCSDDLICSSLLHDYGHFVIEDPKQLVTDKIDGRHEIIGANYLKKFFHNEIIEPILLHVEAKKYLSRDKKYLNTLSDASKISLKLQGGAMSDLDAKKFEQNKITDINSFEKNLIFSWSIIIIENGIVNRQIKYNIGNILLALLK